MKFFAVNENFESIIKKSLESVNDELKSIIKFMGIKVNIILDFQGMNFGLGLLLKIANLPNIFMVKLILIQLI